MTPFDPEKAKHMNVGEAAKFFGIPRGRMRQEVSPELYEIMKINGQNSARTALKITAKGGNKFNAQRFTSSQDFEPIDVAAMRHIQRVKRWVCYSSRVYEKKGEVIYYVGAQRLTYQELLETAAGLGFTPPQAYRHGGGA